MKKLNLKMDNIKEMLSKEQMKRITGGYGSGDTCNEGATCKVATRSGSNVTTETFTCTKSQTGNTISCYCGTTYAVTTNHGVSYCWI